MTIIHKGCYFYPQIPALLIILLYFSIVSVFFNLSYTTSVVSYKKEVINGSEFVATGLFD